MPFVKRLKIEHPREALWWSCDLNEWTADDNWISDFPIIEDEEVDQIAEAVGGIVEEFSRFSNLSDIYARPVISVRQAAE